jgi:hypothetical protein
MIEFILSWLYAILVASIIGYLSQVTVNTWNLLNEDKYKTKREYLLSISPIYIFILIKRKLDTLEK